MAADLGEHFRALFLTGWLLLEDDASLICFLMNAELYKNCDMNIGSEGANSWLCFGDLFGANASSSASAPSRSFVV